MKTKNLSYTKNYFLVSSRSKRSSRFLFLGMVLLLFTFSCQKDPINGFSPIQSDEIKYSDTDDRNAMIRQYAKIVATTMENPEIREKLRDQALLQFDDDYDVLVSQFHEIRLENSTVLSEMEKILQSNRDLYNDISIDFFNKIVERIPNLQIAVPILCEEWKPEDYIPAVTYHNTDFTESRYDKLEAFEANGKVHYVSVMEEPDVPYLVVGISERINERGERYSALTEGKTYLSESKESKNLGLSNKSYNDLLSAGNYPDPPASISISYGPPKTLDVAWSDVTGETGYQIFRRNLNTQDSFQLWQTNTYNDNNYTNPWLNENNRYQYKVRSINSQGHSSWSDIVGSHVSTRTPGDYLSLKKMKFTGSGLNDVESWSSGAPELRFWIVAGSQPASNDPTWFKSSILEPSKRKHINGTWWYKTVETEIWDPSDNAVLTIRWKEIDPWEVTSSFTVNASFENILGENAPNVDGSGSKTFNYKGFPCDMGSDKDIYWWDAKSKIYTLSYGSSNSGFQFQFH